MERLVGAASPAELETYGRTAFTDAIRTVLAGIRAGGGPVPDAAAIRAEASARLAAERRPSLRPVFNLTGTVLTPISVAPCCPARPRRRWPP